MYIFDRYLIVVDKESVINEKVVDYHINTAQKIVNEYFDGINLKEEMVNKNTYYPNIMCERYNSIIILCSNKCITMYVPKIVNNFQIKYLLELDDLVTDYNRGKSIEDLVLLIPHYNNYSCSNIKELLECIGENNGKKRS